MLYVTDNAYTGPTSGFRDTEGVLSYTVPTEGLSAGSVVVWEDGAPDVQWTQSGSFILSTSGDTITMFTAARDSENEPSSITFAVDNSGDGWEPLSITFAVDNSGDGWEPLDMADMTAAMSALPAALAQAGMGSISFSTHRDNYVFRYDITLEFGPY